MLLLICSNNNNNRYDAHILDCPVLFLRLKHECLGEIVILKNPQQNKTQKTPILI